jgi:hypothetical protein
MVSPDSDTGSYVVGGFMVACVLWELLRKKKPRFIVDERGERQRVDHWNRGQPVYNPKTWQQRIFEEATLRHARRKILFGAAVGIGIIAALAYGAGQISPMLSIIVIWGAFAGSAPLLFFGVPALVKEILYQFEYQGMDGAKVLDEQPKPPPGREVVETQMAHGDARLAGEAEALALLNSNK